MALVLLNYQILLYREKAGDALLGIAERAGEADFRDIMGEDGRNVIEVGRGDGLLRLHHLNRARDSGIETLPGQTQRLAGEFLVVTRDVYLGA